MKHKTRRIYCVQCASKVRARLTDGAEVCQHRPDLASVPFWVCDACGNHVGCHHKAGALEDQTLPPGVIATPELRRLRGIIHAYLDPLWKGRGRRQRTRVYKELARRLGYRKAYHTAGVESVDEAQRVLMAVMKMRDFI